MQYPQRSTPQKLFGQPSSKIEHCRVEPPNFEIEARARGDGYTPTRLDRDRGAAVVQEPRPRVPLPVTSAGSAPNASVCPRSIASVQHPTPERTVTPVKTDMQSCSVLTPVTITIVAGPAGRCYPILSCYPSSATMLHVCTSEAGGATALQSTTSRL